VGKINNDSNHPDSPGLPYRREGVTNTATVIITLALVFYSIGVWSERVSARLKVWHLVFFWLGFVCDTWGTGLMLERAGGLTSDVHGITGVIAIVLMLLHAAWATVVLVRKDERWITNFHKFSVVVWLIWLIPYFSPMFLSTPA
jgi:uncharacterized repeat protein (TIGR03987 family)